MIEAIDVGRVRHVLDGLFEQQVIRCDYAADASLLSVVLSWPSPVAGADVAFVRFVFAGVRDFRVLGRDLRSAGELERERSLAMARTFVPEGTQGRRALGIAFHGGGRAGGVAFEYETVSASVRHARVVGQGEERRHRDLASGEALSWEDPFGLQR